MGAVLLVISAIYGLLLHKASRIESNRKRDFDAMVIRNALVSYQERHDGSIPPSLDALEIEPNGVDVSPFTLFPSGIRTGKMDRDVLVEGPTLGSSGLIIRIYRDGEVRWEKP